MNKPEKYLGVITQLIGKKYDDGNTFFIGWIESQQVSNRVSFHQKSLINRKEINDLKEDAFILFETKITSIPDKRDPSKIFDRLDADNCTLNCEKIIERKILEYDLKTIIFIFKYATKEFKAKIISRIENAQSKSLSKEVLSHIAEVKNALPEVFQTLEIQCLPIEQEIQESSNLTEIAPKSFLEAIFQTNSSEYNQNLFHILVDGLKLIDNEVVFQQVISLLRFNETIINNKIENLNSIFYQKSTNAYKFRLWYEGLIDYCATEILKYSFENSTDEFKLEIIRRCKGNENGFLLLNNQVVDSNTTEEVYFSNIRAKLLQELDKAKKSILVAVAWFTNDDLFGMLCMKLKQGVKVELILINDYINNWEFGLPFQIFVDLGGELYFSEYPSIMHHKFCLLDEEIIFNGSYNWTYYAELRNDENIMYFKGKPNLIKEFRTEFDRLKSKLGNPITTVVPFDSSQIVRFERAAFRQYFSTDLTLRAETVRRTNVVRASELASTAIELDTENTIAQNFQKEIQPEVKLQQRTVQVQNIVTDNTNSIIEENDITKNLQPSDDVTKINQVTSNNEIDNIPQDDFFLESSKPVVNIAQQVSISKTIQDSQNITVPQKETKKVPTKQMLIPSIQNNTKSTVNHANTTINNIQKATPIIVENYSVPIQEKLQQFQKLKIVIALDKSGSMDKLYKNGTVQQVVEKLLAVALSISTNEQLDIWAFNDSAHRLISVSKSNFQNYVSNNGITSSGGTKASVVLNDIYKKYFQEINGYNVFAIVLTDGDVGELQDIISNSNANPIFWQFVGLGSDFAKLEELNKKNQNVAFFSLNNISTILDDDLYKKLLAEFPTWYKENESKGALK